MNSDNTGSDTVNAKPYSAIVPPGKTVSANYSNVATYHYTGLFTTFRNDPVTLKFSVTNTQQIG
jgi:hypothetical protein